MEPTTQTTKNQSSKSVLFLVVTFVLLLIIAYVMSVSFKKVSVVPTSPSTTSQKENIATNKTNLSTATDAGRLPAGFPADIPVDTSTITESYTINYKDHGVSQSTVSYTSLKTVSELFKTYSDYLTANGYASKGAQTVGSVKSLDEFKGSDEISVLLTSQNGRTLVQISFTVRS